MLADGNPDGEMFGGRVLRQLDLGACIQAGKHTFHRAMPVAIDTIVVHKPVNVGIGLQMRATTRRSGRTSITMQTEANVERTEPPVCDLRRGSQLRPISGRPGSRLPAQPRAVPL